MRTPVSPIAPLSSGALPLAEFWNDLRFAQAVPELSGSTVQNTTAGGEIMTGSVGARLWQFQVTLAGMARQSMDILSGRLEMLAEAGESFLAFPPFNAYPSADPMGMFLGAAVPQIASLPAGGKTLTLSGLPGLYILTAGDFIAFQRGSPARYELHRLVTGGRADAAGLSPVLQVVPPLRPGVVVGAAVTLARPVMRALIVPGSYKSTPRTPGLVAGPSFQITQTLQKAG